MSAERLQIVVDVDGAGKASGEIRKLNSEISQTGTAGKKAAVGVNTLDRSTKGLHTNTQKATPVVGKLGGTVASLGTAAKVTGGIIAVEFIRQGLSLMISEGREAQKATKATEAVIKSTGGEAKVTAKHVSDLANALSRKAGVDDEVIQKSENLLLTFGKIRNETGKNRDIFDQSAKAAVDMSAAFKAAGKEMSIADAAMQIGKALNDPAKGAGALRRSGIDQSVVDKAKALAEDGKRLQAQQLLLKELRKEFGGAAAAGADPFDKLKVNINNIFEALGLKLLPALGKVAAALNGLSTNKIGQAFGVNARDVQKFGDAMKNVWRAVQTVTKIVWPGIKQYVKGSLEGIGGAIKIFTGLLTLDFGKAWDGVKQIFTGSLHQLTGIIKLATSPLRAAAKAAFNAIKEPISAVWRDVRGTVAGFINDIIGLINKIPGVDVGKINLSNADDTKNRSTKYRARGGYVKFANGGLTQIGRAGDKGHDTIPMAIGGQNVMVGSGEVAAVFNRHQQAELNHRLADQGGLPGFFKNNRKPHYAAGGGIFGTGLHWPKLPGGEIPRAVGKYVLSAAKKYVSGMFGGGGGAVGKGASGSLAGAERLAQSLGLIITSTTGGQHAANSWHYKGRAFDAAGAPSNMAAYFKAALAKYGSHLLELFYDPLGAVKNGRRIGAIGGHSDHVHTALARGGFIRRAKGGFTGTVGASVFGGTPGDDNGIGYRGDKLSETRDGFAELSKNPGARDFSALGGLPLHTKLAITGPNGKTVIGVKRDIGAGGGAVNGHMRRIDLWHSLASRLGVSGLGVVKLRPADGSSGGGKKKTKAKKVKKPTKLTTQQLRDDKLAGFDAALAAAEMDDDDENPATYKDNIEILKQRVEYVKKITKKLIAEREKINKRLDYVVHQIPYKLNTKAQRNALINERTKLIGRRTKVNQDLASYRGIITGDNSSIESMGGKKAPDADNSYALGIGQEILSLLKRTGGIDTTHSKIFEGFANNFVGSFAKGGPIDRTGLALVHQGEHVVPRGGSLVSNAAPPNIVINLQSTGSVSGSVEVDGRTVQQIDNQIGRNARRIRVAPGVA